MRDRKRFGGKVVMGSSSPIVAGTPGTDGDVKTLSLLPRLLRRQARRIAHDRDSVAPQGNAPGSVSTSLEIYRLDGTRLVAQKGTGRLATVDLRQWKGSPLLWRARIDGLAVSGSIVLP